mmetsp:Transcript_60274/g.155205  ORF Transcript_60274/g.155205 Transcript_60274/m.155205 type:complete len:264 (+) Transcript_60274:187-978(+)
MSLQWRRALAAQHCRALAAACQAASRRRMLAAASAPWRRALTAACKAAPWPRVLAAGSVPWRRALAAACQAAPRRRSLPAPPRWTAALPAASFLAPSPPGPLSLRSALRPGLQRAARRARSPRVRAAQGQPRPAPRARSKLCQDPRLLSPRLCAAGRRLRPSSPTWSQRPRSCRLSWRRRQQPRLWRVCRKRPCRLSRLASTAPRPWSLQAARWRGSPTLPALQISPARSRPQPPLCIGWLRRCGVWPRPWARRACPPWQQSA